MIYSGQELPNSQRLAFFEKDPIQWTGNFGLHNFYKTLLELHTDHPALRAAEDDVRTYRVSNSENDHVFSFLRKNGDREVLVILNLSENDNLVVEITDPMISGVFKNVFAEESHDLSGNRVLSIRAWDYLVYAK